MKKFIYVAIMALLTSVMVGCTGSGSTVTEPKIDEANSTVNGTKYDNETYKCWLFEWDYTVTYGGLAAAENGSEREQGKEYYWLTEFQMQSIKAQFDYAMNIHASVPGASVTIKGSSKVSEQKGKDVDSCYAD